jgi:hypothetical protein
MTRRIVMWLEVAVAAVLVGVSLRYFWIFAKYGHDDPYGDAKIALMGGVFLVVGGTAFAAGAAGLRWKGAKAWVVQLLPGALVAWVLWNVLRHR